MKYDFTDMDGIYLSMCEKSVCLRASQAISGSMQSRNVSQCMLLKLLFKASQFAFLKFKIFILVTVLWFIFDFTSKVIK